MCDQMALSNSCPSKVSNNKQVENQPTRSKPSNGQITRKITPNQVLPKKKIPEKTQSEVINLQKNKNLPET